LTDVLDAAILVAQVVYPQMYLLVVGDNVTILYSSFQVVEYYVRKDTILTLPSEVIRIDPNFLCCRLNREHLLKAQDIGYFFCPISQ
jgi:hypothetical protein